MPDKLTLLQLVEDPLVRKLIFAFLIILFGFILKQAVLSRLFNLLGKLADRSRTAGDDFLIEKLPGPVGVAILLSAVYFAISLFHVDDTHDVLFGFLDNGYLIVLVVLALRIVYILIDAFSIFMDEWAGERTAPVDTQLSTIIRKSLKVLVAVMAVLFLIQNLGYSVSGLVASLGLGGLTVALAAKDAVSNFFGSVIIILDSPFKIGDWIKTGDVEGVVEQIGFRSTKVRTFEKSLVTVPNFAIANQAVENFTIRDRRRIKFNLGIEYGTSLENVKRSLVDIRNLIETSEGLHSDFYLVNLNHLADSALEIFIYCFTTTSVWTEYMEIREQFLLDILASLAEKDVSVTFPSQTVYLAGSDNKRSLESKVAGDGAKP